MGLATRTVGPNRPTEPGVRAPFESSVKNVQSDADLDKLAKQADGITAISVSRGSLTPDGAKRLKEFRGLRLLFFNSSFVDDSILEAISDHPSLGHLSLNDSRVGDAGLAHVAKLPKLRQLDLWQTSVTSEGLRVLENAPALQELKLMGGLIDDAALANLKKLRYLRQLEVHGATITDEGLKHLVDYPALESFVVSCRAFPGQAGSITDKGLEHIAKTKIRRLFVARAAITDAGLKHLETMTTLRSLSLNDTEVTAEGLENLKEKLPALRIVDSHSSGIRPTPRKR